MKAIWLILSLFFCCNILAQSQDQTGLPDEDTSGNPEMEYDFTKRIKKRKQKKLQGPVRYKVKFIVVENETVHRPLEWKGNIEKALEQLNILFFMAEMEFEEYGKPKFIYSAELTEFNRESEEALLLKEYSQKKVINIYVVQKISSKFRYLNGYSNFPGHGDFIVITEEALLNPSTLAHEMGHFFGLLHTFETAYGPEPVRRCPACLKSGDRLMSTPATEIYPMIDEETCSCFYEEKDSEGLTYRPDIENIMSYSPAKCRFLFTSGQITIMRNQAKVKRSHLKFKKIKDFQLQARVPVYHDLGGPKELGKKRALIVGYKKDAYWSNRQITELVHWPSLIPFFKNEGKVDLVLFDLDHPERFIEFLDNTTHLLRQQTREISSIKSAIIQPTAAYPVLFLVDFEELPSMRMSVIDHHFGYLKPREIIQFINK